MIQVNTKELKDPREVEELLQKHNLEKLVELVTGLNFKNGDILIDDIKNKEGTGLVDTIYVDLTQNALSVASSVVFGLTLLILNQNDWNKREQIATYISNHPEANGHFLARTIAFAVESKVDKLIDEKLLYKWDKWEEILESNGCDKIGKLIFEAWQNKTDNKDVLTWLEGLLTFINKKETRKKYLEAHRADGFQDDDQMNEAYAKFYKKWFGNQT